MLKMTSVKSQFSLADIADSDAFRKLGVSLAADPEGELSRTLVSAKVVTGPDGMKRTELITAEAADRVRSAPRLFPELDLRKQLAEAVLASPAVPARRVNERLSIPCWTPSLTGSAAKPCGAVGQPRSRGARLVKLVEQEQRSYMAKPSFEEVVELREFNPRARPTNRSRLIASAPSASWQRTRLAALACTPSIGLTPAGAHRGQHG